jgi:hypothetical protein
MRGLRLCCSGQLSRPTSDHSFREHQVGEADLLEHVHHALLSTDPHRVHAAALAPFARLRPKHAAIKR